MTLNAEPAVFPLRDAVVELQGAGLLTGLMLPGTTGLAFRADPEADSLGSQSFLGARLDSRLLAAKELFVALPGEQTHGRRFAPPWLRQGGWVLTDSADDETLRGLDCPESAGVLVSSDPVTAFGRLGRAWRRRLPAKVVAVTGTNGKTTTKDFLAALLRGAGPTLATSGNFNNALGLPLTLLALRPEHQYAVIEMGASAVGEIDYLAGLAAPEVGIITNASAAHLSEFGSLANIVQGKGELLDHLPAEGAIVLNADSPGWMEWQQRAVCRIVSLGQENGDHRWQYVSGGHGGLRLDGSDWPLPLPGAHNANNLAAAILAARALGIADKDLRRGLAAFTGSAHRGALSTIGGRLVLDDCYNANPASMVAAARALADLALPGDASRAFAVLGYMAELGDETDRIHHQTGRELAGIGLDRLLVVGEAARSLGSGFDAGGGASHYCASLPAAAQWLAEETADGDRILIKGSRSAAMEELIPLLAPAFAGGRRPLD